MALPTTTSQWQIHPKDGLDGLKLSAIHPIPPLGPNDCLVKISAVALNYRDIAMLTGHYPHSTTNPVVPTSDGAGTILAIGSAVTLHQVGDRVCTLFTQAHQSGLVTRAMRVTALGSPLDGPLREYAIFRDTGLVAAPKSLDLVQAATLPCAAVTAWNALNGLSDRAVRPGDVVLCQGTGGVSLFALQFALAAGATVIATTSSARKEGILKNLGAHHVINYNTDPNWGETAKALSGGEGVSHVIEVGGEATMAQALKAVKLEGVIAMIGFVGGTNATKTVGMFDCKLAGAIARSVMIGSRVQFEEMNAFIDKHGVKPVIDERIFRYEEARQAYDYMVEQTFVGKIVIRIADE